MRVGNYELLIVHNDGRVFDEILLDGQSYIQVEPGDEFSVKVVVHLDVNGYAPERVMCCLCLDGVDVGYSKYINTARCTTFNGYRHGMDGFKSFQFCVPQAGAPSTSALSASVGKLKVTFFEAVETSIPIIPRTASNVPHTTHRVSETKKFWELPSLTAGPGRVNDSKWNSAAFLWNKVRNEPDATLELKYHSADMLKFLQDLKKNTTMRNKVRNKASAAPPVHVDLADDADLTDTDEPVKKEAVMVDLTQPEVEVKVEGKGKGRGGKSGARRDSSSLCGGSGVNSASSSGLNKRPRRGVIDLTV